jgi:hypothetical protein
MIALLGLFACLDPVQKNSTSGSDSGDTAGGGGGGGLSIKDIREGGAVDGDTVTLTGVLVSSPPRRADADSGKSDGFFVQDPAGGEKSGIYVWSQGQFGDELTVQEGDEVTISGQISEYYDWTELVVGDASSIQVTGAGTLPTPPDLGDGAGVDWDAWESVPVSLSNQTVETVNAFGTGTLSAGIGLDDGFVFNDYDCRGSYSTVTGVIFYEYGAWSLNNRTTDELVGYAAPETMDTTIHAIRAEGVCGPVRLTDVVATAQSYGEDKAHTYLFLQDAGGGEYSGIVAFQPAAFTAYEAGTTFTVEGSVSDYYGLTELYVGDTGTLTATGTAEPVATVITDEVTDWLPWQSALITLPDVTVADATDLTKYGTVLTDKGVYVDNLFIQYEAEDGMMWSSITGPLFYTSFDDVPQFLVEPRTEADLVK